jgi:hypothetical protein
MIVVILIMKTRATHFLNRMINLMAMGLFLACFALSPVSAGSIKFSKLKKEIVKVVKTKEQATNKNSAIPTPVADDSPIDPSKKDSLGDKNDKTKEKK